VTFFITDKEVEDLLNISTRELLMPGGATRSFQGYKLMWKALDFLVVCGRWSRRELIDLALDLHHGGAVSLVNLVPKAHAMPSPASMLEIKMLKSPRLDPATIQPIAAVGNEGLSLDDCLHNVVASLYRELQDRL